MYKKSLMCLFSIFLIFSFLSFTAMAGTGSVKVLNGKGEDITSDNHKEGDSHKNTDAIENESKAQDSTKLEVTESGMDAAETAVTNAGKELMYWIPDSCLKAGLSLSSAKMEENAATGSAKLTYSLYSEEINFFDIPVIVKFLAITGAIYYVLYFNAVWIALGVFALQIWKPQTYSEMRLSLMGEEKYFNIFSLLNVYSFGFFWPPGSFAFILLAIKVRNFITMTMTTQIIEGIGVSSESLPTYFILCVGYYFNIVQKMLAEYGVYLMITLVFVIGAYLLGCMIFGSQKSTRQEVKKLAGCFLTLLLLDVVTIFLIWFGVSMTVLKGSDGYSIAAVITAFIVGALIIWKVIRKTTIGRELTGLITR